MMADVIAMLGLMLLPLISVVRFGRSYANLTMGCQYVL